jgi:hypothetical protein
VPIISGGALAVLLLAFIGAVPLARFIAGPRDQNRPRFWRKPIYASATWTFKDSWATNIALGATAIAAVLTGAGAVSTLLPGVQLDRYAILMAICGAIIVAAPFVFGVLYVLSSGSRGLVPDNATLTFPSAALCEIGVPGGASITLNVSAQAAANGKDPIPVRPGTTIIGRGVTAVLPGDSTIVLMGRDNAAIRVHAPGAAPGNQAPAANANQAPAANADQSSAANVSPEMEFTSTGGHRQSSRLCDH